MILIYYLSSYRINHQMNVPVHFGKVGEMFRGAGVGVGQRVFYGVEVLRRALWGGDSRMIYIVGHSDKRQGLVVGESVTVNGEKFGGMLPPRRERRPELIFFNTCHAVQTGLVNASLKAGVKTVIASNENIPIIHMCDYAESFFHFWLLGQLPLRQAIEKANATFFPKDICFQIYEDE